MARTYSLGKRSVLVDVYQDGELMRWFETKRTVYHKSDGSFEINWLGSRRPVIELSKYRYRFRLESKKIPLGKIPRMFRYQD